MKNIIIAIAAAIALSMLLYHVRARAQWMERKADLDAQIDSTNALLDSYSADSTEWSLTLDSLALIQDSLKSDSANTARELTRLRRSRVSLGLQLRALQAKVDVDSLPPAVRDLLRVSEQTVLSADSVAEVCSAALDVAQAQRSVCEREKEILTRRVVVLEVLRDRLTSERDSADALNKPPALFSLAFELGVGPSCQIALDGRVGCGLGLQLTLLKFRLRP